MGTLGSLTITDKLLVACLDSDVVEPTPDKLLELVWGRWRWWEAGTTTIDTPSPIWNVRDCDTLVHNQHTSNLQCQGL